MGKVRVNVESEDDRLAALTTALCVAAQNYDTLSCEGFACEECGLSAGHYNKVDIYELLITLLEGEDDE